MKNTLTNEQLIAKAKQWVKELCESGGRKWSLRVPVDLNHDPDVIFIELCNRLEEYAQQSQPSPAGAAEGASEGMAEALRFAKWLADNDYRPGSGNKHWFKWNGMEVDENPLTIEQCYQIFASLSPGVEDGSGWVKDETISDGFGGEWLKKCPDCGKDEMAVVRPGKVQCNNCG